MKLAPIEDTVVEYPATGDYDINVWVDSEWDDVDRTVSLTFYPLVMDDAMGYMVTDPSTFYTLRISLWPRGPKHKAALQYIIGLVNEEDTFDANYTEWWSNECVLVNPPELIADFMATLPRKGDDNV
jgi:hypothetical protein